MNYVLKVICKSTDISVKHFSLIRVSKFLKILTITPLRVNVLVI
jgi:hypothetical protein